TDSQQLTIVNQGVATVRLLKLTKADGFNSDVFKVPSAEQVQQSIEPGASITLTITYAPEAASDDSSSFTISTDADDATNKPLTVNLTGTGVTNGCVLTPSADLDFGNVKNDSSYTKNLVVQNTTPIDWVFDFEGLTGADAALFSTNLQVGNTTIK